MLRNYLTTALRVLLRQKIYSAINVFGLALGIASVLLIALYITDELSYDGFHKDADRIFRMGIYARFDGNENWHVVTGAPIAEALQRDFPEIESTLRIRKWVTTPVQLGEKIISVEKVILADSNFFSFFSFHLMEGNPRTSLKGTNKIVLTESTAKLLFGYTGNGDRSPIGKILLVSANKTPMEVSGIAADPPAQSHFHFNAIVSMATVEPITDLYIGLTTYNYFKTRSPGDESKVEGKLRAFFFKYVGPEIVKINNRSIKELWTTGDDCYYFIQPIVNIHLDSHFLSEMEANGDRTVLRLLGWISGFVILLACVNFVNLATARAIHRAKEVGIRKTVGAIRSKLVRQFLFESFLYTSFSVILGLAILSLVLGPFNLLAAKALTIDQTMSPVFLLGVLGLTLLISFLSGLYPAFHMTSFRPSLVLKGKLGAGRKGLGIRNSLVVFQFAISIILVIGTLTVYRQINFLQERNPGFQKENIICLTNALSLRNNAESFKNGIKKYPEILNASFSSRLPSEITGASGYRKTNADHWHTLNFYGADEDHLKTLGLIVENGRFFSKDYPSDTSAVILNQRAANLLGITNLDEKKNFETPDHLIYDVIGIIKDFNFESAKSEIKPLVIFCWGKSKMAIRISPGNVQQTLSLIKSAWQKHTDAPFEYSFLDENLNAQYKSEEQLQRISIVFTILSIVIACLGLLGLVTYTAGQRTKEIGIRKVMGATVRQVVFLLSRDFVKLVLVASLFALPLSWYGIGKWLETFAVRTTFNFVTALGAGAVVLAISLIMVSYQSIKAAMGNPAESLRNE